MATWLMKSEPSAWSWSQQLSRGEAGEPWNGVRNHQAKNHLLAMKKGDQAFFYHSVDEKRIVGIVEIICEAYPDHTDESGKFVMVDVRAIGSMPNPVTLEQIKQTSSLAGMALLKQSRLSVQPVSAEEWQIICNLGGWSKKASHNSV